MVNGGFKVQITNDDGAIVAEVTVVFRDIVTDEVRDNVLDGLFYGLSIVEDRV